MKKILSAFALTTIALGFAFSDAKVNLQYRTQASLFNSVISEHLEPNKPGKSFLGFDNTILPMTKDNGGLANATDDFKFSVAGDVAGVTLTYTAQGDDEASGSAAGLNNRTEYSAWVQLGSIKLSMGSWKNGLSTGALRCKNDVDAGNHDGNFFERYKPGNIFASGKMNSSYIIDMTNFSGGANTLSAYVEWTGEVGSSAASLQFSVIQNGTAHANDFLGLDMPGFGLRANFNWGNVMLEGIVKSKTFDDYATGLFLLTKPFDGTTLVLGASSHFNVEKNPFYSETENTNPKLVDELALDVRLRSVFGSSSLTFFTNVSWVDHSAKGGDMTINNAFGGLALPVKTSNGNGKAVSGAQKPAGSKAVWNLLAFRSALNDTFTVYAQIGHQAVFDKSSYKKYGSMFYVNPGVQIYANKGASVAVGVSYAIAGLGSTKKEGAYSNDKADASSDISTFFKRTRQTITVPCIIRVKL